MIDTHAHLNTEEFKDDLDACILRAIEHNIEHIIVIGMDEASNQRAIEIAESYDFVYASVGIHPGFVDQGNTEHLSNLLKHPKVVAIGECGLDFYWTKENIEKQKDIFIKQIELAVESKYPLVIHTRNSFTEAYDLIKPYQGKVTGVFHCFSSNVDDAKKAIDLGFYIGIDGPVTYKKALETFELVKNIDLKHLLIETDSPYLAPVPFRGKRNEPSYVRFVAEKIAEIKEVSLAEVIKQTSLNAKMLFNIGGNL
ncbi:MAG: TatD family hydrolase [Acholeplasmataceae bacterium]|nr:TatD family hydrolase [Acholeplasmataceae bacterium]